MTCLLRVRLLLIFAALSSLTSSAQSAAVVPHSTISNTDDGRRYVASETVGISMLLPLDWIVADEDSPGYSQPAIVLLDLPQTMASMEMDHVTLEASAELFQKTTEEGFQKLAGSFEKLAESSVVRDGHKGVRVSYLSTTNGIRTKLLVEFFSSEKDHWTVSAFAPEEVFEKYRPTFDLMLESVRFVPIQNTKPVQDVANEAYTAGQHAFDHGDMAQAKVSFEMVTAMAPGSATAWTQLGRTYLRLTDYTSAEKAFRKVIQLQPQDQAAYGNLGIALSNQGRSRRGARGF
jgi:tetratricopeptide (TPR) repeat protein